MLEERVFTAVGTSNIALIKYWGKRNEQLILPTNSSISLTLDENLSSRTSVIFSERLDRDSFYLNGKVQDINDGELKEKFQIINRLRTMAGVRDNILVVSENNFPTAAGLASSAAGMSTLVFAASNALGLNLTQRDLSIVVRMGSGSACRSIAGGFVRWNRGELDDGSDSYAEQIFNESHWPEVTDVIAVVSEGKKRVSSRSGMRQTMQTSALYQSRPQFAERMARELAEAIGRRDFNALAEIAIRDSNNMHATMLDTYPPISYLNDTSREIMNAIHEINESAGEALAAYTFDAGPNAHVITTDRHIASVRERLSEIDGVSRLIESKAGRGPRILGESESLIDVGSMLPKRSSGDE